LAGFEDESITASRILPPFTSHQSPLTFPRHTVVAIRGLERAVTIIERTLEEALLSKDKSERDSRELLHR
jgi:hypothetical protein